MPKGLRWFIVAACVVFALATALFLVWPHGNAGNYSAPLKYREAVSNIVGPYSVMQKALAADDLPAAKEALPDLRRAVEEFGKLTWIGLSDPKQQVTLEQVQLNFRTTPILSDSFTNIALTRRAFQLLALEVQIAVEIYGHAHYVPFNLVYCSMAFNNEGAYWIQDVGAIRNPYFGKKMLECGQVARTFPPGR